MPLESQRRKSKDRGSTKYEDKAKSKAAKQVTANEPSKDIPKSDRGRHAKRRTSDSPIKRPTSTDPAPPKPKPGPRPRPKTKVTIQKLKVEAEVGTSPYTFISKDFARSLGFRGSRVSNGPCYPGSQQHSTERIRTSIKVDGQPLKDEIDLYVEATSSLPYRISLGMKVLSQIEPLNTTTSESIVSQPTVSMQLPIRNASGYSGEGNNPQEVLQPRQDFVPFEGDHWQGDSLLDDHSTPCPPSENWEYTPGTSRSPQGYESNSPEYSAIYSQTLSQSSTPSYGYSSMASDTPTASTTDSSIDRTMEYQPPELEAAKYSYQDPSNNDTQQFYAGNTTFGQNQQDEDAQYHRYAQVTPWKYA